MMQLSEIGGHLTARTGIDDLMEDLFKALHSGDAGLCQLNGGSPAVIPEVTELWRRSMEELVRNGNLTCWWAIMPIRAGILPLSVPWCVFSMNVADGT